MCFRRSLIAVRALSATGRGSASTTAEITNSTIATKKMIFAMSDREGGDAAEAEKGGDQRDEQKGDGPTEHDELLEMARRRAPHPLNNPRPANSFPLGRRRRNTPPICRVERQSAITLEPDQCHDNAVQPHGQVRESGKPQNQPSGDRTMHCDPQPAIAQGWFTWFAHSIARLSGKPATFLIALAIIVIWAVTGPIFGFSDTWQLVVNTATTIVTFLMVFLIQNTQNRDTLALQIKLAELIIAMQARTTTWPRPRT